MKLWYFYRPQTKFAKVMQVMFSQVSVCPQGVWQVHPPGQVHPTGQVHPPEQVHPHGQVHPLGRYIPVVDGQQAGGTHSTGMQSCYPEAFLWQKISVFRE